MPLFRVSQMADSLRAKVILCTALVAANVLAVSYVVLSRTKASPLPELSSAEPAALASASAEPSASPTASAAAATAAPTPAVTADTVSDDSLCRLINADHPVDASYVPSGLAEADVTSDHVQMLRTEAIAPLQQMMADAKAQGVSLKLISGYRSYTLQVSLQNTYIARYGRKEADRFDDHPGASEHQLGLAVDLGNASSACELQECFSSYPASQWLEENAWKYGFILRYPESGEAVTGIRYSPWHYRYIGTEEAAKIHDSGLTMEEYYAAETAG